MLHSHRGRYSNCILSCAVTGCPVNGNDLLFLPHFFSYHLDNRYILVTICVANIFFTVCYDLFQDSKYQCCNFHEVRFVHFFLYCF